MTYDKNISPVGWYVCSYLLRFVELEDGFNDDLEHKFTAWENTVLIRASSIEEAFDKTVSVAQSASEPYSGGEKGVPVQWVFEGITMVLPVYEELEDGAEIIWTQFAPTKLKNLRKNVRSKASFRQ